MALPYDLYTAVIKQLPEAVDVRSNPKTKQMIASDQATNIFLRADATIKVAYAKSSQPLNNSLAFFTFKPEKMNTLQESDIQDLIFFPSFTNSMQYNRFTTSSNLRFGDAVTLGKFKAGDAIGFTLIQNFWDTATKYGPRSAWYYYDYSKSGYLNKCKQVFRTIRHLNPEPAGSDDLQAHTLLFSDIPNKLIVLSIENLHRGNEQFNDFGPWDYPIAHDFNDAILAIQVEPFDAVITDPIPDINTGKTSQPIAANGKAPQPIAANGLDGQLLWREVTEAPSVIDPIKAAKKLSKTK